MAKKKDFYGMLAVVSIVLYSRCTAIAGSGSSNKTTVNSGTVGVAFESLYSNSNIIQNRQTSVKTGASSVAWRGRQNAVIFF